MEVTSRDVRFRTIPRGATMPATEYLPPGSASCAESVAKATDPPNLIWLIPAKEAGLSSLDAVPESGAAFLCSREST
jgi:hypothetical protein